MSVMLDNLITALQLAEAATESLSVPALSNVVKVALRLVELAKEIKETQDEMRSLAVFAAKATEAIYDSLRSFEEIPQADERLDDLLSTLQEVEAVMIRAGKKSWYRLILHSSKHKEQLEDLKTKVNRALETFHIQGSIRTDLQLSMVRRTQVELLQHADDARRVDAEVLRHAHDTERLLVQISNQVANSATYDGTMRLFGRDDLELLEELDPESPIEGSGEKVVRYKAKLRENGNIVVVRYYPRLDEKFRHEVEVVKSLWHPNVAHPLGYSKLDPHTAFIVIDGSHTRTFNERSRTFHGPDKMKWMMKAAKETCAGLVYLSKLRANLGWSPDDHMYALMADNELLVSDDGRVLLDLSCFRLDRLPNTIIHDDGMIELHTRGRELIKAFKFDLDVSPAERYKYLQGLWRDFVQMADFSRDESTYWGSLRIPGPGEAFSLSNEEIIPEIVYDDLVNTMTLVPEYSQPHVVRVEGVEGGSPLQPAIEHGIVLRSMQVDGGYMAKTRWRRYTVRNIGSDWMLETVTGVRESADCRGWFMNEAPHLCGLPGDLLEDLAVVYALKFRTRTSLLNISGQAASRRPPPRLYFYERVHDYPHASLDPKINWPWGFWSMNPDDDCEITEFDDAHLSLPARHSIAFLGISPDREFTWVQQLGSWMFYIQARVEVEYYTLTPEECLVLNEMHQYSGDDDRESRFEEIADPDIIMSELTDFDSEDEDAYMGDDLSQGSEDEDDEFDDWMSDESRTAENLGWLSGPLTTICPREPTQMAQDPKAYARARPWASWLRLQFLEMRFAHVAKSAGPGYLVSTSHHGSIRGQHALWYGFS